MPATRRPRPARGLRPRGPLPARVYWTRRLVLLGTVVLLVVGLTRLLGAGGDGADGADTAREAARPASATTQESPGPTSATAPAAVRGPRERAGAGTAAEGRGKARPRRPAPLAAPEGRCEDADVRVVPEVPQAVGGSPVTVRLLLRTTVSEACWWYASPDSLTLRIRSGDDEIWSSRQCPRALPRESVVVRRAVDTVLEVTWSARRSDDECSRLTAWALPGWYHVEAAALSGEPSDLQFRLTAPERPVVERTVPPSPSGKRGGGTGRRGSRG
ncbi:hypothetical protein [Nocardioides perillae]|uniref:DUF4232 domain-containing protein n=1 Tax=Nocardioides perillae TaxID=1119534 RepID=A0A7Y9UUU7_9ACTN|nr:hypothetical protein [Nocardioides perillae]NYG53805.1 hypothetical protein [Nocardioides perillae]